MVLKKWTYYCVWSFTMQVVLLYSVLSSWMYYGTKAFWTELLHCGVVLLCPCYVYLLYLFICVHVFFYIHSFIHLFIRVFILLFTLIYSFIHVLKCQYNMTDHNITPHHHHTTPYHTTPLQHLGESTRVSPKY